MKVLILVCLINIINVLNASQIELNTFNYPADYTAAPQKVISKSKKTDENRYYQKVVLDYDNVYRLKTFKRVLTITPSILKQMVDIETKLSTIDKLKLVNSINKSFN